MMRGSTMARTLALATVATWSVMQPGLASAKDKKEEPAAEAAPKYDLSPAVRTAVVAAQAAFTAQDYATDNAQLTAAEAALKTDDDRYVVAQLRLQLAQATKDNRMLAAALDQLVASPKTDPANLPKYLQVQGELASQANDYAKAQTIYTRLATLTPNDPNVYASLTDVANKQNNPAQALTYLEKAMSLQQAAGQPVDPRWTRTAFAMSYKANNQPGIQKYGTQLIKADPTAENWRNVVMVYRETANLDEQGQLDLYRLLGASNALKGAGDYLAYAQLAQRRGLPGEVVSVLDSGGSAVAGNPAAAGLRSSEQPKVAADRKSLAGAEAQARSSGRAALAEADGYMSFGDYAKAATFYQLALQKGGVDADLVNTRLGIALGRGGMKAEAKQALAQVKGARAPLAQYWSLWVDTMA